MTTLTSVLIGISLSILIIVIAIILYKRNEKQQNAKAAADAENAKKGLNLFTELNKANLILSTALTNTTNSKKLALQSLVNVKNVSKNLNTIKENINKIKS